MDIKKDVGDKIEREYRRTHPWISFVFPSTNVPPPVWILLGEAQSKCDHLAGVPLRPQTADELNVIFLVKGAHATTAIEGNTLSEDEVRKKSEGTLELPTSKEYLGQEVQNILDAFNRIMADAFTGRPFSLSLEKICEFNAQVLKDLPLKDGTSPPGVVRSHSVGVMNYRGAPAEDCEYLLRRLCDWINGESFKRSKEYGAIPPLLAAVLAHLYLAWIHPFGDGNGRTARLVEFGILINAGVPAPAAHLLSDHYNSTRSEYYRQLDMASRSGGDIIPFIRYAIQGLVDGLRGQITSIRSEQMDVVWRNYVHERFRNQTGGDAVVKRRRELVLALSGRGGASQSVPAAEIPNLSTSLARLYFARSERTLQRDLAELEKMGLLVEFQGRWRAHVELIEAFLPARRLLDTPNRLPPVPKQPEEHRPHR